MAPQAQIESRKPTRLLDLPIELGLHILGKLNFLDLVSCSLTCRGLKAMVADPTLLYIIELGKSGMREGHGISDAVPVSTRLDRLRKRQHAWKMGSLAPIVQGAVPFHNHRSSKWCVFDGLFMRSYLNSHRAPDHQSKNTLHVFHYSSVQRQVCCRTLDLEYDFDFYCADVAQDLLVLRIARPSNRPLKFRILSLETREPHPESMRSDGQLRVPVGSLLPNRRVYVTLSGNLLFILGSIVRDWPLVDPVNLVIIANWKTGAEQRIMAPCAWKISTHCIVAQRYLLLGGHREDVPTIDVYYIGCNEDLDSPVSPVHLSTYNFPAPDPGIRRGCVKAISVSEPSTRSATRVPGSGKPKAKSKLTWNLSEGDFVCDPLASVLVIQVSYPRRDKNDDTGDHEVIVPLHVFLPRSDDEGAMDALFEWSSWGPRCTRWFPNEKDHSHDPMWMRSYHLGYKVAYENVVLDFNPYEIAQDTPRDKRASGASTAAAALSPALPSGFLASYDAFSRSISALLQALERLQRSLVVSSNERPRKFHGAIHEIVTAPTVISAGDGYMVDIVSWLPYRISPFGVLLPYRGIVLSGDVLIGLKTDRHGVSDIDVFGLS